MNDRNEYEAFNDQNLIDNLNAAFALRPFPETDDERGRKAKETAFLRYIKAYGNWERNVWKPAQKAVKEAGVEIKFDYRSGRYFAKYDADGQERFAIRVTCTRHFDVIVAAGNQDKAKAVAIRAMDDEHKIAKNANKKARFSFATTAEITSKDVCDDE